MFAQQRPRRPSDQDDEDELLSLIAAFSLEDIHEIQLQQRGSGLVLSDEDLAFRLFAEEAHALQTFARDMTIARGLGDALRTDAALIEEHERYEDAARWDREVARAIAEGRPPPPPPPPTGTATSSSTARNSIISVEARTVTAPSSSSATLHIVQSTPAM